MTAGDYSEVAAEQLDDLEESAEDDLWDAIVDACDLALNYAGEAQRRSTAVVTDHGDVVFRLPVAGFPPYKVFWSLRAGRPRIEAVFRHS